MTRAHPDPTAAVRAKSGSAASGHKTTPAAKSVSSPTEGAVAALQALLKLESQARAASDLIELRYLIANASRRLVRARQVFVVEINGRGAPRITTVSSVGTVDGQSTLVQTLEQSLARLGASGGLGEAAVLPPSTASGMGDTAQAYPFAEQLWLPFRKRDGSVFAGMLMAREFSWGEEEKRVALRLAEAYGHAWQALSGPTVLPGWARVSRRSVALTAALLALALFFPVPMTALAPVEIVAESPYVVTAELDGVIEDVPVEPGTEVRPGQVLVRFSDTVPRNRLEVAAREVRVGEARLKQVSQVAFDDSKARHDIAIAQAELELKKAEARFAGEILERSVIKAERAGLAVFADRKSLVGKPVATGERIMEIADPGRVEARIELAIQDVMALEPDSAVKLFLDVEPLAPRRARVVRSDFRARPADMGFLAFTTVARLDDDGRPPPRLGLRGTAQIFGRSVPLGLYLLRRPISALRQGLGL